MRGDRPNSRMRRRTRRRFTPHARGSTLLQCLRTLRRTVYPACAGIDRYAMAESENPTSLPRMRGDRPLERIQKFVEEKFTPHARGSTHIVECFFADDVVYPACAGIDLGHSTSLPLGSGLPARADRPCVGVSIGTPSCLPRERSTLALWG